MAWSPRAAERPAGPKFALFLSPPKPLHRSPMRLLITGGCGFIGSNFVRLILSSRPGWTVDNVDALTYAGNPATLAEFVKPFADRYVFHHADIADSAAIERIFAEGKFDAVVNFAAESHVDRSIS